jgi:hypothetical protein
LTVETLQDVPRIVMDYLNEQKIRCDHYDKGCRELVQLNKRIDIFKINSDRRTVLIDSSRRSAFSTTKFHSGTCWLAF